MIVQHTQEDGHDRLEIVSPDGGLLEFATLPIEGNPIESAVGAMWSGYDRAEEVAYHFKAGTIMVYSTTPGAIEQFGKEMKKSEEEYAHAES